MQKFDMGAWVFFGGCIAIMVAFGIAIETAGTKVSFAMACGVVGFLIVGFGCVMTGIALMSRD